MLMKPRNQAKASLAKAKANLHNCLFTQFAQKSAQGSMDQLPSHLQPPRAAAILGKESSSARRLTS